MPVLKLLKNRRAVSPVLATLLMVAVAVSMSVIIFMWSQGFLATTSEAASSQQQAQNVAAQSSINIETIQFTTDVDPVTAGNQAGILMVVRDIGTTRVTIGALYVDNEAMMLIPDSYADDGDIPGTWNANKRAVWGSYDSSHNTEGDDDGTLETNEDVPPQGYAKIWLKYSWTAGQTYIIKVTTTVGTFAQTVVTAPA